MTQTPDPYTPLLSALSFWTEHQPNKLLWSFLSDKGELIETYTYQQIDKVSSSLALTLLNTIKPGDRAMLVFVPGLHFAIALLACFKAKIIAVPVFPPDPNRLAKDLHHFVSIQSSSGAAYALTHNAYNFMRKLAGIKNIFQKQSAVWPELVWISVDDIISKAKSGGVPRQLPFPAVEDIAFLQYTSGSTSEPKGVMISHDNLAHNLTTIIKELKANPATICVSWLPQYHDMGLIGSYLGTLYCGGSGYYLSPISFLKDPVVWLVALSKYKGTHTQAPNFAYALSTRKYKEHSAGVSLDLSSVENMLNAAEPVDDVAIDGFYNTFESSGLKRGVVIPTYGLAEHTVFVCSGGKTVLSVIKSSLMKGVINILDKNLLGDNSNIDRKVDISEQRIVGCGFPRIEDGIDVVIVHEEERELINRDCVVGEIWVQSRSKAKGYWDKPDITQRDFHARYRDQGADKKVDYLRTGDLGFMHNGELFICGRSKDLIIVRGANHYPQDIERTAEKHCPELRPGCTAAFSLPGATPGSSERVVYIAEVKDGTPRSSFDKVILSIKQVVALEHGIGLSIICLLETKSVPKTTSGKIARAWCRMGLLENSLKVLKRWEASAADEIPDAIPDENYDSKASDEAPDSGPEMIDEQQGTKLTVEETRALSIPELTDRLETALVQVTSQGSSPIERPVNPTAPLGTLGLDSLSMVQFNAVLERRFYCKVPDEFIFSEGATLTTLAGAVQRGGLSREQKEALQRSQEEGGGKSTSAPHQRTPLCPWFVCCY